MTFNPEVEASSSTTQPKAKPKRRVQMGDAINAETGEVMDAEERRAASVKRKSQRKHTILNTSAHVKRMKKDKEKKVRHLYSFPYPNSMSLPSHPST